MQSSANEPDAASNEGVSGDALSDHPTTASAQAAVASAQAAVASAQASVASAQAAVAVAQAAVAGLGDSAVEDHRIVIRFHDPNHHAVKVMLWADLTTDLVRDFVRVSGGWELSQAIPPLGRLEYMIEVFDTDDSSSLHLDTTNPRHVDGAFGPHSWLPMPGYAEPAWLGQQQAEAERVTVEVEPELGSVRVQMWAPADTDVTTELPLLITHDGPEMDAYGRLTEYVATGIASGKLPPMRVALVAPGARDEWYSANPAYAKAFVEGILPAITEDLPMRGRPILMGQSLGGLIGLYLGWHESSLFDGLFLQSGSYFTAKTDDQESGFATFQQITAFTGEIQASGPREDLPAITIVCGTAEENLENNQLIAAELERIGADVGWGVVGDGHTWTCWRDLLDPHLTELIQKVWS